LLVAGGQSAAPGRRHLVGCRYVLGLHLGAQHEHLEAPDEAVGEIPPRLQQETAAGRIGDEELEQHLALGGQQGRMHRGLFRERAQVRGDAAVEEFLGIGTGNAHHAAVGEERHLREGHVGFLAVGSGEGAVRGLPP
jgi:hypothetical protein